MKSLVENSIFNIIYRCSNLLFPLIISTYASRMLFADGIGKVASAQNVVTYFTTLAALGLPTYGIKAVAILGKTKESRSKVFSELFCINAFSTLISSVLYCILLLIVPYFRYRLEISIVCGLAILFNFVNVDWFYQGCEEYGYIMIRNIIVKIISLVSVFLFVHAPSDYIIYALVLTLSRCLNNIFNIFHLRKYVRFTLKNLDFHKHLKPVLVLFASSLAIEVYTLIDTTMLTFIYGDEIVGYYSIARKCIDVARALIIAICAVFLPRLSYYYSVGETKLFNALVNKGVEILLYLTIPATVGVVLTADYFIPLLFGDSFNNAVLTTQILSFSLFTVAFSNFFGYQVLVTVGMERKMFISTVFGAISNIFFNLALIFTFRQNGVAFASVLAEFIVTVYQVMCVKKLVIFRIPKKFIKSIIFSSLIMFLIIMVFKKFISDSMLSVLFLVLFSVTIYYFLTYLLRNSMAIQIHTLISVKLKSIKMISKDELN